VGRLGVGLDNIDTAACSARGIEVIAATGANAVSVAEYVVTTAMILLRGVYGSSGEVAAGRWPRAKLSNGHELRGKTLGLIGFGSIGRVTARLARNLGVHVVAHDPLVADEDAAWREHGVASRNLEALLAEADVISLHVPLMPQTRGLLNAARIALMKRGAIVINSARGGIVDESALIAALRAWRIGRRCARCVRARAAGGKCRLGRRPESDSYAARGRSDCGSQRARQRHDRAASGRRAARDEQAMTIVSLERLESMIDRALSSAGAGHAMASSTARALVAADAQSLTSHGAARVPQYVAHLKNGRANGQAMARIVREKRRRA
jgi:(S)-sulfolactate dehydrogenase